MTPDALGRVSTWPPRFLIAAASLTAAFVGYVDDHGALLWGGAVVAVCVGVLQQGLP